MLREFAGAATTDYQGLRDLNARICDPDVGRLQAGAGSRGPQQGCRPSWALGGTLGPSPSQCGSAPAAAAGRRPLRHAGGQGQGPAAPRSLCAVLPWAHPRLRSSKGAGNPENTSPCKDLAWAHPGHPESCLISAQSVTCEIPLAVSGDIFPGAGDGDGSGQPWGPSFRTRIPTYKERR